MKAGTRLGPCVGDTRHFIAIGLNYADHAAETGAQIPKEPIIFQKAPTSIVGPNDDTMIPKGSTKLDYECEIAIVIGARARYLSKKSALDVVAGYCICNDVSERNFQAERGGAVDQGQGLRDLRPARTVARHQGRDRERAEARHVARRERREAPARQHQDHDLRHRAHRLVLLAVLRHGAGRRHHHRHAAGRRARHEAHPVWLKAGDTVSLGIEGLGEQKQKIVRFKN